jgi:hypothetical protein
LLKLITLCTAILLASSAWADSGDEWQVSWTPYIWASSLSTDVGFRNLPELETQVDFKDLIKNTDMAYMHFLEFKKGNWGLMNDFIYFDVSDSGNPGNGILINEIEAGVKQSFFDLAASYTPDNMPNTTFYAGLRRINVELDLAIDANIDPLNRRLGHKENWTNFLVGIRQVFPINDRWFGALKADYSGDFGDETGFILNAGLDYTMTELLSLKFGYRYASVDFESTDFTFDQTASGPFVGLSFNW